MDGTVSSRAAAERYSYKSHTSVLSDQYINLCRRFMIFSIIARESWIS